MKKTFCLTALALAIALPALAIIINKDIHKYTLALAPILMEVETTTSIDGPGWKVVGNEAESLGRHIQDECKAIDPYVVRVCQSAGRNSRELNDAIKRNDLEGAKTAAKTAANAVLNLMKWTEPKK